MVDGENSEKSAPVYEYRPPSATEPLPLANGVSAKAPTSKRRRFISPWGRSSGSSISPDTMPPANLPKRAGYPPG
jgi:hypothetical protein